MIEKLNKQRSDVYDPLALANKIDKIIDAVSTLNFKINGARISKEALKDEVTREMSRSPKY